MLYHASPTGGLTVLTPHVSNHGHPLVYFSKKRENVLVYLSNAVEKYCRDTGFVHTGRWEKWGPYGFDLDGVQRLEEYYPNALEETYAGVSGYIYGAEPANTVPVSDVPFAVTSEEAAAVESVASTGGQIMPPIMGAGAFIMAEIIGVQYAQIAAAAVLPAVAYFLAVFILVHMIAKKKGLGKDSGVHYEGKPILPRVYRLLPIVVLVVMIIMGYSLPRSAIYCTIFSIIIAAISPETRMGPRKLLQTLMDGVRQAANIAIPTAACGIMIGIVVNSGVAVKIAKLIGTSGEGSLFIALLIAALGCLLLGMALPTVAAYLIAVTLFASAIQGLGISALVTNMFIFYFGVVAQITPPVCLASFTAAGIAGASAWKTGWKAFSFAITAFIVPFAFVYRPAILLEGTMVEIIIAYCIVIAATYLLACGIAGYLFPSPEDVGAHRLLCCGLHLHPAQLHV